MGAKLLRGRHLFACFVVFEAILWYYIFQEGLYGTHYLNWKYHPAHNSIDCSDNLPTDVLELHGPLDPESLCDVLQNASQGWMEPFVIRDYVSKVEDGAWGPNWFSSKYGDVNVKVRSNAHLALANHEAPANASMRMSLQEAITNMLDDEQRLYINFNEEIFGKQTNLSRELPGLAALNALHKCGVGNAEFEFAELFMGHGKEHNTTGSVLHAWGIYNYFYQVHGAKHWTFVPPDQFRFLSTTDGLGFFHSHVGNTLDSPHIHRLQCVKKQTVVVNAGDLLYNPPWWGHEIHNNPGWNVAIATKSYNHLQNMQVSPLRSIMMYSFLTYTHGLSYWFDHNKLGTSEIINHGKD